MKHNNVQSQPSSDQSVKKPYSATKPANLTDLTRIENGESVKVVELQGGNHLKEKLEAMKILPGTIIVKKSASLMKGPIVIENGNTQFAIGYGMAQKILVEPVDNK